MSRRVIPRSVQFMGCAMCGETEKTLRRVGEDLLCSVCAGRAVSRSDTAAPVGARGSRRGPLVLREINIDEKEER
nr:MAG TPA: adenylate kinase [Caudoviricetes sp.]